MFEKVIKKAEKMLGSCCLVSEPSVFSFPQTWGDTTCGGGGCGGQAITTTQTTVVYFDDINSAVVFVGKPYVITNCNQLFWTDLHNFKMASVKEKNKYID